MGEVLCCWCGQLIDNNDLEMVDHMNMHKNCAALYRTYCRLMKVEVQREINGSKT